MEFPWNFQRVGGATFVEIGKAIFTTIVSPDRYMFRQLYMEYLPNPPAAVNPNNATVAHERNTYNTRADSLACQKAAATSNATGPTGLPIRMTTGSCMHPPTPMRVAHERYVACAPTLPPALSP